MDENSDSQVPAADPPSNHETPGANPVNEPEQKEDAPDVEVEVETPGGTTVTESPSEDDGIKDSL